MMMNVSGSDGTNLPLSPKTMGKPQQNHGINSTGDRDEVRALKFSRAGHISQELIDVL
jgi:hypothetical protein